MRNNQPVVNAEYLLSPSQYLISRTDLQGRIVYANPAFVEVSGFERAELIGEHHNVVRHPHMPAAAFADLWSTLKAGHTWVGYVKNRRKDGRYYWVLATVSPIVQGGQVVGYGSVRVKPDSDLTQTLDAQYRALGQGTLRGWQLQRGRLVRTGWRRWAGAVLPWQANSLKARLWWLFGTAVLGFGAMAAVGVYAAAQPPGQDAWLVPALIAMALAGTAGVGALACGVVRAVRTPLREALFFARQVGAGNLEGTTMPLARGEVGELMFALDIMRKSLVSIAHDMNQSVSRVVTGSAQIAQGNANLADRTQQQAAALEQTAASLEQFAASVAQNAASAGQASQLAAQSTSTAGRGSQVVQQAVERMRHISATSGKITEIIGVINDIAFQTNILALNAAVEAARAGSQGRGFAVVAGEVRALAQKSAQAAREIKTLIEQSATEIDSGADLVAQSGSAMAEVVQGIQQVSALMVNIAEASQQQATGITEVKAAVTQMDAMTQQNATLVEAAAAAAGVLRDRSTHLSDAASVFLLRQRGPRRLP